MLGMNKRIMELQLRDPIFLLNHGGAKSAKRNQCLNFILKNTAALVWAFILTMDEVTNHLSPSNMAFHE